MADSNKPILDPETEADFKKRMECFKDWVRLNPDASPEDTVAFHTKITPETPMKAKLFAKWCVLELKRNFLKNDKEGGMSR